MKILVPSNNIIIACMIYLKINAVTSENRYHYYQYEDENNLRSFCNSFGP